MANETLKIIGSLDIKESISTIMKDLDTIQSSLNNNKNARLKLITGLDLDKSKALIQANLNTLVKSANAPSIKLNVDANSENVKNKIKSTVETATKEVNKTSVITPKIDITSLEDAFNLVRQRYAELANSDTSPAIFDTLDKKLIRLSEKLNNTKIPTDSITQFAEAITKSQSERNIIPLIETFEKVAKGTKKATDAVKIYQQELQRVFTEKVSPKGLSTDVINVIKTLGVKPDKSGYFVLTYEQLQKIGNVCPEIENAITSIQSRFKDGVVPSGVTQSVEKLASSVNIVTQETDKLETETAQSSVQEVKAINRITDAYDRQEQEIKEINALKASSVTAYTTNNGTRDSDKILTEAKQIYAEKGITVTAKWTKDGIEQLNSFIVKVKEGKGVIQEFKYVLDETGKSFKLDSITGSDSGVTKLTEKLQKTIADYTQKLAQFKSTNNEILSGLTAPLKTFEDNLAGLSKGTSTINDVINSFKALQTEASNITANFSKKLNPITAAVRDIAKGKETLAGLRAEFRGLNTAPKEINSELTRCTKLLENVKKIESEKGRTAEWSKAYREWADSIDALQSKLKVLKKEEANSASTRVYKIGDLKDANIAYMSKALNTVESQMERIYSMADNRGWQIVDVKGIEDSTGLIKKLNLTITDTDGALKQLVMTREKMQGKGKINDGFVQTGDVQVLKTAVQAEEELVEIMAKAREQSEKARQAEEKRQQLSQNKAINKALDDEYKNRTEGIKKYKDEIENTIGALDNLANKTQFRNNSSNTYVQKQISEINTLKSEYQKLLEQLQSGNISPEQFVKLTGDLTNLKSQFNQVQASAKQLQTDLTNTSALETNAARVKALIAQLEAYKKANNKAMVSNKTSSNNITFAAEIDNMIEKLRQGADPALYRQIANNFRVIKSEIKAAGLEGGTFFENLWANAKKFGSWMGITASITRLSMYMRQMFTNVVEIDKAMISLQKVTDETASTYEKFLTNTTKRAKELGTTVTDLVNATAEFAKLGHSLEDASVLGEVASIYANVGELDIEQASNSLVSTMAAFNIEAKDAIGIVDIFNKVGNEFSITSGGIGDALQRSASSLNASGNSLAESVALITAANKVLQDTDVVGTALKTVSLRLTSTSAKLEELGEDTEYACETISDYRDLIMGLTHNKVDILGDDGQYKNTYNIIKEISEVWKELDSMEQSSLVKSLFGVRQANVGVSLIEQFQTAEEVLKASIDASGSAMAEHSKWLEGAEAKIQQLKAAFESLSQTAIDDSFVKGGLDLINNIVTGLESIIEHFEIIPTLITAIVGVSTLKGSGRSKIDSPYKYARIALLVTVNEIKPKMVA